ncbi:uncharacterized protein VICG_00579 [Vittaforma corneae ATCC 50505]|uniref:Uncharacterized protein n=1 Tax=Vittaforma corneae (strain ATCC 50505) TaxID=993615 RepID=L2GPP7_VITCO|nr:uncharacterized protein VICG_00579 [Vittaforma corneae ATCC 50505]ELA42480.1 hypothetical protein VICG_00579 [Vittaforma corneae ATCC 50505]
MINEVSKVHNDNVCVPGDVFGYAQESLSTTYKTTDEFQSTFNESGTKYMDKVAKGCSQAKACFENPKECLESILDANKDKFSYLSDLVKIPLTWSWPELLFSSFIAGILILSLYYLLKFVISHKLLKRSTLLYLLTGFAFILLTICLLPDAPEQISTLFNSFSEWVKSTSEELKLSEKINVFFQEVSNFLEVSWNAIRDCSLYIYESLGNSIYYILAYFSLMLRKLSSEKTQ